MSAQLSSMGVASAGRLVLVSEGSRGALEVAYLEEQVGGGSDPLLEQDAQGPVLLLQVTHPRSQLHTLFSQVLQVRRVRGQRSAAAA